MPQKQKIPAEEKVSLIRRYKAEEISLIEASREGRVDIKVMQGWIRQYEAEGLSAFLPGRKNRVYRPETKQAAVTAYLSGESSIQDICKKSKPLAKPEA